MAATKTAKKPVPLALVTHQWQPGQSGNPRGVLAAPKYLDCLRICREASAKAAETMVALLEDDDSRVRLMAADKILERAWGKPREMKDEPPPDPEAEAKRTKLLTKINRLLEEDAAKRGNASRPPDPPTTPSAKCSPERRAVGRGAVRLPEVTDPPPPTSGE